MPLPLTVSCFSKIQIGFTFWYWLTRVVLDKGPLNGRVCNILYSNVSCSDICLHYMAILCFTHEKILLKNDVSRTQSTKKVWSVFRVWRELKWNANRASDVMCWQRQISIAHLQLGCWQTDFHLLPRLIYVPPSATTTNELVYVLPSATTTNGLVYIPPSATTTNGLVYVPPSATTTNGLVCHHHQQQQQTDWSTPISNNNTTPI